MVVDKDTIDEKMKNWSTHEHRTKKKLNPRLMGSIPVEDSDLFFAPSSCHVDQFTFHISLLHLILRAFSGLELKFHHLFLLIKWKICTLRNVFFSSCLTSVSGVPVIKICDDGCVIAFSHCSNSLSSLTFHDYQAKSPKYPPGNT